MARAGLLEHLIEGVLNPQSAGNLQTNFDVLVYSHLCPT